jgi:16S rRNA (adenine1518-N6/adenine1519-N6)-dimethyltransferase
MKDLNVLSVKTIKSLITQYSVRPSKKWGQNFLIERSVQKRMLEAAQLQPEDVVLEVGPGFGALTFALAEQVKHVIAVEIDSRIMAALQSLVDELGLENLTLLNLHILSQNVAELLRGEESAKVVANIPYSITSPLLDHLLSAKSFIPLIALMVQKEVAERIAAKPGTKAYGSLSLFVQYHAEVEYLGRVQNSAFYPRPEVDSAIVRLTPVPDRLRPRPQRLMFKLIRAAFKQRRKNLRNALADLFDDPDSAAAFLRRSGIDPARRGETLTLEEYMDLAKLLSG